MRQLKPFTEQTVEGPQQVRFSETKQIGGHW
jgi:hypothetical protein